MTEKEAIKVLGASNEHISMIPVNGIDTLCYSSQMVCALEMAEKALEKQVPKKPTDVRYFGEAGYYIGLCPSCNAGNNSEYQYCGDCGQKLDWEGGVICKK